MSILIKTRLPKQGNRSPHLVGWWKMDEGEGNILYDSSGNNNHLVSGLPGGFTTPFWGTDGWATFNESVSETTDCAIIAPNSSTAANVAMKTFWELGLRSDHWAGVPAGKLPNFLVVRRYIPIRAQNQFGYGWGVWQNDGANYYGFGVQATRTSGSHANGPQHKMDIRHSKSEGGAAGTSLMGGSTWEAAAEAKFGDGNDWAMGNERHETIACDRDSSEFGVFNVLINGTDCLIDQGGTNPNFDLEADITTGSGGYCWSIGSRGPRVESNREVSQRMRDFQLYMTWKGMPADIHDAADALGLYQTLTREDWD